MSTRATDLPDDLVLVDGLRLCSAEREPEPGPSTSARHRYAEQLATDEIPVGHAPRRIGDDADNPGVDCQIVRCHAEIRCRQIEQCLTTVRRRLPKLRAGESDRQAPDRRPLVDRPRRVAHDHANVPERDVELLGDDLREGCPVALTEIRLAGECCHASVSVNREPGIERGRVDCRRPRLRSSGGTFRCRRPEGGGRKTDRNDQGAATFQEGATRELFLLKRGHVEAPNRFRPLLWRHA